MMTATEVYANDAQALVTSGGTTAPSPGTVETWTVTVQIPFQSAVTGVTQFHIADVASGKLTEKILVTNGSGSLGVQTWTVTRGVESTTPVAHLGSFIVQQVITAGNMNNIPVVGLNVLNPVFAGGADPTGAAASDAAINAALNTAPAGPVYVPPGTYLLNNPINLYGSSPAAPVPHRLIGLSLPGDSGVTFVVSAGFGAKPAINASTKYAPAGTATQFHYGAIENIYINLTAAPTSVGIYYDRVTEVSERDVKVRGGACGRVVGWCADMTFTDPKCYNVTDSFWKWLHAYTADAPWDTAEAGHTVGGAGATYSDSVDFKLLRQLNYITSGMSAGTTNAFWTVKAGNDFQFLGGHSLRAPGISAYITNGLNVDFSGYASQKNLYLFADMHEIDSAYDNAGNGAGVTLNNVATATFGDNFWCSAAPAADAAAMWSLKLTNCIDIQVGSGYWNGKGVLLDGVNTRLNFAQTRFPQSFGNPVFSSGSAGTLNSSMNTLVLPQGSISVDGIPTANLPATGTLMIATSGQPASVAYTGWSGSAPVVFTGCTGGSGTLATGGIVVLGSVTASRFAPRFYSGALTDSVPTLALLAQASPAQFQGPAMFLGNAVTPGLQVGRADGKAWQITMDTSATGTLIFKNSGGTTRMQMSDGGTFTVTGGDLDLTSAGKGLKVAEGSNAKQGTSALSGGTVTVANTSVTATSRIFLTSNADGGTPGWLRVSARSVGTSFTITSSSGTDTSTVAWEIFEVG